MSDQNIDQLRAEAAMRRQAIATDLELVGDRVSPSRMAERRKARFRERVHGMRNSIFGTSERPRQRWPYGEGSAYGHDYYDDDIGYGQGRAFAAPGAATDWDGGDGSEGHSMGDRASDMVERAKQATPDSLGEVTEGNPFGAAVVGFGIGMLAATLLPSSPDERRAAARLQGTLQEGAAELGRTGKEAMQHVKPEAEKAVEDVKKSAKESVESVKSDAQGRAESVKGTAQEKADEVRSSPQ